MLTFDQLQIGTPSLIRFHRLLIDRMSTWILLLRGINVGGKNSLTMRELTRILESFGLENVKTYIQSGNAVFQAFGEVTPTLSTEVAAAIEEGQGFRPHVLLLRADELEHAVASNPFPEAEAEPKTLHLYFLASAPTAPDLDPLRAVQSPTERFHLADRVFYLHAPDGMGRSKLAAKTERCLGVAVTARNWRTVKKLWEMVTTL